MIEDKSKLFKLNAMEERPITFGDNCKSIDIGKVGKDSNPSWLLNVLNGALIRLILKKTPYKLWKGRKLNISYIHAFGCKCFILINNKDNLGKLSAKSDESIFLAYSTSSKVYRVFNKRTLVVEKSIYVVFMSLTTLWRRKMMML
jgi:hypothetical protein